MIKFILFDVDDTIIDWKKSAQICFQNLSDKGKWGLSGEEIYDVFLSTTKPLWEKVDKGEMTGVELRKMRWPLVLKNLGLEVEGAENYEEVFRAELSFCAVPVENAKEVLEKLSKKYPLGIASNAYMKQQSDRLTLLDFKKYFTYLFTSMDVGAEKPHREFYEHCLKEMGNPDPESVLMIGDSPTADVEGSKNAGLRACFLNKRGLDPNDVDADYIINDLKELLDIL